MACNSTYEDCVNSPRRELRVFTAEEGGEQHCQIGNISLATDYLADWKADVLGELPASLNRAIAVARGAPRVRIPRAGPLILIHYAEVTEKRLHVNQLHAADSSSPAPPPAAAARPRHRSSTTPDATGGMLC